MNPFLIAKTTIGRRLIPALLILFVVISIGLSVPAPAYALGLPFGGFSLSVFPCLCSFNLLITYAPVNAAPPMLIYQPGATILYLFGQIFRPGVWLLGLYGPPVACIIPISSPPWCVPMAVAPMMTMVGTSM